MCKICKNELLSLSVSKNWDSACLEWECLEDPIMLCDEKSHCVCGHSIHEIYTLTNKHNNTSREFGNVCIVWAFTENAENKINVTHDELIMRISYYTCKPCGKSLKRASRGGHLTTQKHMNRVAAIALEEKRLRDKAEALRQHKLTHKACRKCAKFTIPKAHIATICYACGLDERGKAKCACGNIYNKKFPRCYHCSMVKKLKFQNN